jgi:hypothetical protein
MTLNKVNNIEDTTLSSARFKILRRILLVASFALLLAIIFVGLRISAGYILGGIASVSFVVALTCRWRKIRNYLLMILITVLVAIFVSMIYVEVFERVVHATFGESAFESTGWKVFDILVNNILLFFVPACIIVGIGGSIVLYSRRVVRRIKKNT